jgi:hypothetical protein
MTRSTKLGIGVLCIFALPFVLAGLTAIQQGVRMAHSGSGNAPYGWVLFGVLFTAIGCGLIFVAFYGAKRIQGQQHLESEHPTEPWLWRKDWAQGRANSKTRNNTIAGWVFTIFWNAISMPIAYLIFPQLGRQKGAYVILLFPAAGVYLLISTIRQTIALSEFGNTYFEMASVPGVIGREVSGQIQARFPHSPDRGVHLRLSCVHRVTTNSGNSSSTSETIQWRDEADLSSAQLFPGPRGTTIPVSFRIPLDVHVTEKINARDEFVWVLEALADVPGINYHDIFEVPVFRTAQTPTQSEAAKFAASVPTQPVTRPNVGTVKIRQNTEGTEFYFPAARNKNFATSATMFMLVFGAISVLLIHRVPILFPFAFGFFALLLAYFAGQLWLGTTRVVIGASGLTLQSGLLGGGRVRQIQLAEIASIDDRITAQQGRATGTPYYDIELKLRDGKKVTLGRSVRNKQETEWLVDQMQQLAGLRSKSMTAGMA